MEPHPLIWILPAILLAACKAPGERAFEVQEQGAPGPVEAVRNQVLDTATKQRLEELRAQPSLIARLNTRYTTTSACAGGIPTWHCNGLVLRRSTFAPGYAFWTHSPAAKALGSVTFSYIRSDSATNGSDIASGFIFMDDAAASAAGKALPQPRCIYPFMAGTQNSGRPLHGCGFIPAKAQTAGKADESTCATLATPAITAPLWIANFERFGSDRKKQCSLSTQLATQLTASLEVRRQLASLATTVSNEMLVPLWDETQPKALPIEAFFYNASTNGSFDSALKLRDAYYTATQQMLPIVRFEFNAADRRIVKPPLHDELGKATAAALNLRYDHTEKTCADGKPSIFCNGVIIRTTSYSTAFHAWNPSNTSVASKGVSFSYVRKDSDIKVLAWNTLYQGLIFSSPGRLDIANMRALEPMCIYPSDAATFSRRVTGNSVDSKTCGDHVEYPSVSDTCASRQITTLAQLKAHYQAVPGNNEHFNQRNKHQCSLAITPDAVALSLQARKELLTANALTHHNELMIGTWPQNIPELLPLEAFFYQPGGGAAAATQARNMQQDLVRSANGLWVPVIRVDLDAGAGQVFTYSPADQG